MQVGLFAESIYFDDKFEGHLGETVTFFLNFSRQTYFHIVLKMTSSLNFRVYIDCLHPFLTEVNFDQSLS